MPKLGTSAIAVVRRFHPNVKRIVEAKSHHRVTVTPKDCKSSTSKSFGDCAMAKACKREADGAIISRSVAYIVNGTTATRYTVPTALAREIVSFDRSHHFEP